MHMKAICWETRYLQQMIAQMFPIDREGFYECGGFFKGVLQTKNTLKEKQGFGDTEMCQQSILQIKLSCVEGESFSASPDSRLFSASLIESQ